MKKENLTINEIIKNKENFIIIYSTEEPLKNLQETLENYNTIIINLKSPKQSDGWNPFEYPYELYKKNKEAAFDLIDQLAETIFQTEKEQDPFWSQTAGNIFSAIAISLFEDAKKDEINLTSILEIIELSNIKFGSSNYLTEYFKTKEKTSYAYISASATVFSPFETQASIISVAKQKLRPFLNRESILQLTAKTTFNQKTILEKPTAIFIITREGNTALNTLAETFTNQIKTFSEKNNKHLNIITNYTEPTTKPKKEIKFPILEHTEIKTFNAELFINKQKKQFFKDYKEEEIDGNISLDEILKKLDKKIIELEKTEKELKNKDIWKYLFL